MLAAHEGDMNDSTTKNAPRPRLVPIEPYSWQIARGDTREARAYEVHLDGVVIGTVRNGSRESWRKSGRIRTSLIGYPAHWEFEAKCTIDMRRHQRSTKSRAEAVDRLIALHLDQQSGQE